MRKKIERRANKLPRIYAHGLEKNMLFYSDKKMVEVVYYGLYMCNK